MTLTRPRLAPEAIDTLAAALRGDLVREGDDAYDDVRALYNAMIDKRPALIARCVDVADVITALRSEERRVGKECASMCRSRWSPYH